MPNIAPVRAAFTAEIAKISNTLLKAEATYLLERWIDAVEQQALLESNEIASYSIAGRTVTVRNLRDGQQATDMLKAQIYDLIYGKVTLADLNSEVAEPVGRVLN